MVLYSRGSTKTIQMSFDKLCFVPLWIVVRRSEQVVVDSLLEFGNDLALALSEREIKVLSIFKVVESDAFQREHFSSLIHDARPGISRLGDRAIDEMEASQSRSQVREEG